MPPFTKLRTRRLRHDAQFHRTFVMLLHLLGLNDHEIALQLMVSVKTVSRHRQAQGLPVNRARRGSLKGDQ